MEEDTLAGSRCLVFGGSGTLGRVVCRTLASQGSRVAFTYHTGEAVAMGLASDLPGGAALPLDLTVTPDIDRTVREVADRFGGIDGFVQCAAVGVTMECAGDESPHRITHIDERGWDLMMSINAKSSFFAVKSVAEVMKRVGGGNIVLLGSIDGVKSVPSPVHYAASKGALRGMTQAMAKELGEYGIRVNMVAAGVLEGGLSRNLPDDLRKEYLKHCGLGRLGRLEEVASVVAYLTLENTYVTGQTIILDGAL